jgi:hypothetical protein
MHVLLFLYLRRSCGAALLEAFHAARRIENLLVTREERVARAADFNRQRLPGRARGKCIAAGARYRGARMIGRMDVCFHDQKTIPQWAQYATRTGS